jgi:hypothetical protein
LLDSCPKMVVEKGSIVLAVPHESVEQIARYRERRFGIPNPNLQAVEALIAAPPFLARGRIGYRDRKDAERGAAALPSFFAMLEVSLTIEGARARVVLVNREKVLAMGIQTDAISVAPRSSLAVDDPRSA